MNSELNGHLADSRIADWRRDADRFRRSHSEAAEPAEQQAPVTVRYAQPADTAAIAHIASLDGRPAPSGRTLVAEVDGRVLAARSVESGASIADPFRPTAHLTELLELRAAHLRDGIEGAKPRRLRRRVLFSQR
jgi:hypothetical protein